MDESIICRLCGDEKPAQFMMEFGLCPTCYAKAKAYLTLATKRMSECEEAEDAEPYARISRLAQLLHSLCELKTDFTDRGIELFEDVEDCIEDTVAEINSALKGE